MYKYGSRILCDAVQHVLKWNAAHKNRIVCLLLAFTTFLLQVQLHAADWKLLKLYKFIELLKHNMRPFAADFLKIKPVRHQLLRRAIIF